MSTPAAPDLEPSVTARDAATARLGELVKDNPFYGEDGPQHAVVTILADLRAFCDANGLDFAQLDRAAYQHYRDEIVAPSMAHAAAAAQEGRNDDYSEMDPDERLLHAVGYEGEYEITVECAKNRTRQPRVLQQALNAAIARGEPFAVALMLEHGGRPFVGCRERNMAFMADRGAGQPDPGVRARRHKIDAMLASAQVAERERVPFHASRLGEFDPWSDRELLLLGACEAGDRDAVTKLRSDPQLIRRSCIVTGFVRAAHNGHLSVVGDLRDAYPDIIDEQSSHSLPNEVALVAAARGRKEKVAWWLLQNGASAGAQNGEALVQAASMGLNPLMVELVVNHGVHPSVPGQHSGGQDAALYNCSVTGNADGVDFLLENGADPLSENGRAAEREAENTGIAERLRSAAAAVQERLRAEAEYGFDNSQARVEGWELREGSRIGWSSPAWRRLDEAGLPSMPEEPLVDVFDAITHVHLHAGRGSAYHQGALERVRNSDLEADDWLLISVGLAAAALKERGFGIPAGALGRAVASGKAEHEQGFSAVEEAVSSLKGTMTAPVGATIEEAEALIRAVSVFVEEHERKPVVRARR